MIATHPLKTSSVTLPPFQTEPRQEGLIPVFNLVLSGHTSFNFANRTTVISFRPHGYPATILTTISISDTSSNWLRPCCNRGIDYFLPTTFFPFEIERKLSRFTRSAVRFATMPVNYFEFVNISGGEFDWPIETIASWSISTEGTRGSKTIYWR